MGIQFIWAINCWSFVFSNQKMFASNRNSPCQNICISSFKSLPFPCRKLQLQTGPITLCKTSKKKDSQDYIAHLNQISCAQVDYASVETGLHRLPVNFNCTASEYNKLLITNGRSKETAIRTKANPLDIQNVECLNVPIYLKKQQEKEEAAYHMKEKLKNQVTEKLPDASSCACCCCQDYCQQCDEEIRLNQLVKGTSCTILSNFSPKTSSKTLNKRAQNSIDKQRIEEKRTINHSQEKRQLRIMKEKQQLSKNSYKLEQFSKTDSQQDLRVQKIIDHNLTSHKNAQMQKKRRQNIEKEKNAQAKEKIAHLAEKIRHHNKVYSQQEFIQKYPWGINQKRIQNHKDQQNQASVSKPVKPITHQRLYKKPETSKSKQKIQQPIIKCHPVAKIPPDYVQVMKMIHFKDAMGQLKRFKIAENEKKNKTKQQLQDLQIQRKKIIEQNPKRKFEPKEEFKVQIESIPLDLSSQLRTKKSQEEVEKARRK